MRVAVVGHTEWIDFVRVPHLPASGEILHAADAWEEPGGGGAVAAGQLARLAGDCVFITAFGDGPHGPATRAALQSIGVRVEAALRSTPHRRAITFVTPEAQRTIVVLGDRLGPEASDPIGWDLLDDADAVYFTAGDVHALHRARRARVLVATPRAMGTLRGSGVELDALVGSAADASERFGDDDLDPPPRLLVRTEGAKGGTFGAPGEPPRRFAAAQPPGPPVDSYGCGDSFAAGLTFALGKGMEPEDAVALAARCGAACLTGRGPYAGQLR